MPPVCRVVVRDKFPMFDGDIVRRPLNRAALVAAGAALGLQTVTAAQEIGGTPGSPGPLGPAPYAAVAFLWLALGGLVFLQRRARRSGQMFLLAAAAGSIFLALAPLRRTLLESCLFATGLLLFPPLLFAFARAFDERKAWRFGDLTPFAPALALIWPVGDALYRSDVAGVWWRLGLAFAGVCLVGSILQVARDTLAARSPADANELRALLIGLVGGTAISVPIFLVPVIAKGSKVDVTLLPPLVLLFLLAVGYSVLVRELSGVDFFLRRGIVYAAVTIGILAAYAVLGVVLAAGRATVSGVAGGLGFVAVAVSVGAGFTPVRRGVRRLIDWLVYGERLDRWDLLQALSERLGVVMSPAELGATLVEEVGNALSAAGALLLSRQDAGQFTVSHEHLSDGSSRGVLGRSVPGSAIRAALGDPPAPLLLVHARPVLPSRRERVPDRLLAFQRLHVSLVIPLQTRSGLEAVLCLRAKRTHEGYNAGDLALLAPVIRQAAAALDTSLLFARLEETVAELRAAYRRIASEQEAERARLAGELHDGIAQELANLITLATVAERQMEAGGEAAGATLAHLRDQAQTAYGEVRRVSHALRPVLLDDYGLASSLRRFAQTFQAASGIEVIVELAEVDGLSAEAELALFRVAQECLENARKHSGTRRAAIHLGREDGRIVLRVADEGRGVSADGSRGLGLVGMRERVEAVGGALRIESQEGRGASIEAAVPVEDV